MKVIEYTITTHGKVVVRPAVHFALQQLPPKIAQQMLALEFPTLSPQQIKSLHDNCRAQPWGVELDA